MPLRRMDHGDVDPADELRDKIGFIDDFEVPLNKLLLAIYMGAAKTKSGIILTDKTVEEGKWQGVCCLILKAGPMAFQDDERFQWHGFAPQVGEWIVIRPSDGLKIDINSDKGHCRMIVDSQVWLKVPSPDGVW